MVPGNPLYPMYATSHPDHKPGVTVVYFDGRVGIFLKELKEEILPVISINSDVYDRLIHEIKDLISAGGGKELKSFLYD